MPKALKLFPGPAGVKENKKMFFDDMPADDADGGTMNPPMGSMDDKDDMDEKDGEVDGGTM